MVMIIIRVAQIDRLIYVVLTAYKMSINCEPLLKITLNIRCLIQLKGKLIINSIDYVVYE